MTDMQISICAALGAVFVLPLLFAAIYDLLNTGRMPFISTYLEGRRAVRERKEIAKRKQEEENIRLVVRDMLNNRKRKK